MIHYLLAKYGIPSIEPAQFAQMPLYLAERKACVCVGMPPYSYWQPNPELGRIPQPGEALIWQEKVRISVLEATRRRIDRVRIERLSNGQRESA